MWLSHVANEAKPVSFIKVYSPRPLNLRVEPSHRPAYCQLQCRHQSCRCQCLRCLTSNSSWKLSKKVTRLSYSSKIQNRRWPSGKLCILWKARRVFQPPTTKKYKRWLARLKVWTPMNSWQIERHTLQPSRLEACPRSILSTGPTPTTSTFKWGLQLAILLKVGKSETAQWSMCKVWLIEHRNNLSHKWPIQVKNRVCFRHSPLSQRIWQSSIEKTCSNSSSTRLSIITHRNSPKPLRLLSLATEPPLTTSKNSKTSARNRFL